MNEDNFRNEDLKKSILAREHSECIFREKILIPHALIEEIKISEWGVKIRLVDLKTPGFIAFEPEWEVSGSWESLGLAPADEYWQALHVGWTVYFSSELRNTLIQAASEITDYELIQRYPVLGRLLNDYEDRVWSEQCSSE